MRALTGVRRQIQVLRQRAAAVDPILVTEAGRDRDGQQFTAVVGRGAGATHHRVHVRDVDLERLAPGVEAKLFVTWVLEFLLAREPKESILDSFDISVVPQYFAEFEAEALKRFAKNR